MSEQTFSDIISGFIKGWIFALQEYWLLTAESFKNLFLRPFYISDTIIQADLIGVGSLPIVILTGFFTGAVMSLQLASTLSQYGQISRTGQLVSLSLVRELGPVLTALMISGRNASGMASELGSMVVTEQVDAMRALGTDPVKKLVTPRLIATTVMTFFLTIISDVCGLLGGYVYAVMALGLNGTHYWSSAYEALGFDDLNQGLIKPIFFGMIVATVGCFFGMKARGGTQGVGRATTQSVVVASVFIIVMDFIISSVLKKFSGLSAGI